MDMAQYFRAQPGRTFGNAGDDRIDAIRRSSGHETDHEHCAFACHETQANRPLTDKQRPTLGDGAIRINSIGSNRVTCGIYDLRV
jgi:hypothetical protein